MLYYCYCMLSKKLSPTQVCHPCLSPPSPDSLTIGIEHLEDLHDAPTEPPPHQPPPQPPAHLTLPVFAVILKENFSSHVDSLQAVHIRIIRSIFLGTVGGWMCETVTWLIPMRVMSLSSMRAPSSMGGSARALTGSASSPTEAPGGSGKGRGNMLRAANDSNFISGE